MLSINLRLAVEKIQMEKIPSATVEKLICSYTGGVPLSGILSSPAFYLSLTKDFPWNRLKG
jgi:hypothetical protein